MLDANARSSKLHNGVAFDEGVRIISSLEDPREIDALLEWVSLNQGGALELSRDRYRWGFATEELVGFLLSRALPGAVHAERLRRELRALSLASFARAKETANVELAWLSRLPSLERLSMHGACLSDLRAVSMPGIRVLELLACALPADLCGLDAPSLETLRIHNEPVPFSRLRETAVLRNCASLRSLVLGGDLEGMDLSGLASLQDLEQVVLYGAITGCDLSPLGTLPKLRSLSLGARLPPGVTHDCRFDSLATLHLPAQIAELTLATSNLRTLEGISRCTTLQRLTICSAPRLTTLRALSDLGSLAEIFLGECSSLETLEGLPRTPATNFTLCGASSLRSLEGIDALEKLEEITLSGCSYLADITALTANPKLSIVDLTDCFSLTDISAFERCPSLGLVVLHRSGVTRKSVPVSLRWACSWAEESRWKWRMRTRPASGDTGTRKSLAQLRKLLKSDDFEIIAQGFELAASLADAALHDALLGAAHTETAYVASSFDGLISVSSKDFRVPMAQFVVLGLLRGAPPESAVAERLRAEISGLLAGGDRRGRHRYPFDPRALEALPALERLHLYAPSKWVWDGVVPSLAALRQAVLAKFRAKDPLGWLVDTSVLDSITLTEIHEMPDLAPLAQIRSLRRLDLHRMSVMDLRVLPALEQIEELSLRELTPLRDLGGIERMRNIRRLSVSYCPLVNWQPILSLPSLKHLVLHAVVVEAEIKAVCEARGITVEGG